MINDTRGHLAGDEVLRARGALLNQAARDERVDGAMDDRATPQRRTTG